MYTIERTSDASSLFADSAVWDQLSGGVPTRESAWLGSWWKIYGEHREAYIVTVRDSQGNLCGLLPLYRLKTGREGRTLCAMGDGATCTDHFSVLARESDAPAIAAEIGRWLARVSRDAEDGWDLMDLDGLIGGDRSASALVDALRGEGAASHASSRMNVWVRATHDDWETHLSRICSHDRRKSKRHLQNLQAADKLRCRTAATAAEARVALDVLIDLHQQRWTAVGEPGSYATPQSRDFIHAAAQGLFQRGQLQLIWVELDQRPISSELRILGRNGVMYCYCTGMDRDHAKLEPGRLLQTEALLYAYQHGLQAIDYMRGDEAYKQRMLAEPRPLIRLRVIAPSLLPRLRHAAWLTGFELKQFIRRRTGRSVFRILELP